MKAAIIGYGKMGHEIERVLVERGHEVLLKVDVGELDRLNPETAKSIDVAFEFTTPATAYDNIKRCLSLGVAVVSGSTGWTERKPELDALCLALGGAFFYSSNYSIGVNILFRLNRDLARMMASQPQYKLSIEEVHHIHKLDAPSGTAITLAEGIADSTKGKITLPKEEIHSIREGEIAGIHTVSYDSPDDTITISHSSKSRRGLASGAVTAAEWVVGRHGVFGMNDLLNL
ncbi:MAG: 4-hydroxy-tetrahydrodipicolinate reductase [Tidjanibacter sp.]|nr:4-hydroxy-tetrahydrodipicolinate reductase [Tidjanibacter sp.]